MSKGARVLSSLRRLYGYVDAQTDRSFADDEIPEREANLPVGLSMQMGRSEHESDRGKSDGSDLSSRYGG